MRLGFRLLRSLLVACCVASFVMAPALAQVSTGTDVSGTIVDRSTGLPVAGATVALYAGDIVAGTMTTDVNGTYTFPAVATGEHYIEITALGFGTSRSDHFSVAAGRPVVLQNAIERVSADRGDLKNIATVNVGGSRDLQTTTVIHSDIDASTLQRENFVRVGDALNAIPGVNLASQSSAVGDDVFVNIRGVGVTESATLLDGHPIGPVGVAAGTFFNGAPTAFDFQDTPSFALRNIQTVFGSGALGLYGSDAIGGVVDLQTLDPTPAAEFRFHQGIGNNGQSTNVISASGTNGRLGYVFVNGVEGSYGNFAPQTIAQTGLLGTDYRSATLTANTYPVSGNYLLRTDLLKLRYALSPATTLTLTGYSGTSWDDKSGNGDNDFLMFDQQLYTGTRT
ncbi:MAG: carboxypeptidase regulatory-like domain-containing protein, partial [Vulcanimicrobiaceae bacterium]